MKWYFLFKEIAFMKNSELFYLEIRLSDPSGFRCIVKKYYLPVTLSIYKVLLFTFLDIPSVLKKIQKI